MGITTGQCTSKINIKIPKLKLIIIVKIVLTFVSLFQETLIQQKKRPNIKFIYGAFDN